MELGENDKNTIHDMMPLLIDIQQNLHDEIDLNGLAERYGYSSFYFHRLFSKATGETPKRYVERLRLEKAAYKLCITNESILDIALSVGFSNHETFSRAFKRNFDLPPRMYRNSSWEKRKTQTQKIFFNESNCSLSDVRFESLRPMTFLSIRHIGDYYEVPDPFQDGDFLWSNIIDWAVENKLGFQQIPIAILHDDPNVTPKAAQRCDACIPVERSMVTSKNLNCIEFSGGLYGTLEHIGPYATLDQAFRKLADTIASSEKYQFREGEVLDIMRKVRVGGDTSVNHTDIYLPIEKIK